jgi:uncharacterized protein (TIGR02300 family)
MRSFVANPELGTKQICPSCQSKFYDLGRRPAVCPKCGASFDPEEAVRNRRVRSRSLAPDYETDEEEVKPKEAEVEGFEDEADETPEIDEAAEVEPLEGDDDGDDAVPGEPGGGPDVGVGFEEDEGDLADEDGDDVPFIEDEEDDFVEDDIEGLPGDGDEEP